ncbi:MAG: hypothetical protein WCS37_08145 [Chloroflexota bacterium]|nr:hypothetical protein [Chloroflexota bacterium]
MGKPNDYDSSVKAIEAENKPVIEAFEAWLKESGLNEKTIKWRITELHLFAFYLINYETRKLTDATSYDVSYFLLNWFPRKALR